MVACLPTTIVWLLSFPPPALPFQTNISTDYLVSNNQLSLTCLTSHLPTSYTLWKKDSINLDPTLHNASTALVDVAEALYSNHLSIDWDQGGQAVVECLVFTEWIANPSDPYYEASSKCWNVHQLLWYILLCP